MFFFWHLLFGSSVSEKEVIEACSTKSADLGYKHWKLFPDVSRLESCQGRGLLCGGIYYWLMQA
jgi:hypothetical protein